MPIRTRSLVAPFVTILITVPVVFAGCSDDDPVKPAAGDAGLDSGPVLVAEAGVDTGSTTPDEDSGTGNEAGVEDDAGTGGDAGDGGDAGACSGAGGFYTMTGTCTNPALVPAKVLCVRQKTCAVTANTEFFRQGYAGTIAGQNVTATTETPAHQDCTGTVTNSKLATLSCVVPSVAVTCNLTATPVALKGATDTCCSVTTQDCGTGERCQPIGNSTDFLVNACIPDRGTVDVGGACTRLSTDVADFGNDDCKKGHICTATGQSTPTTNVCQKLCTTNTDCPADSACFTFGLTGGICRPRCSIFAGGTAPACGTGTTCRAIVSEAPPPAIDRQLDTSCLGLGTKIDGEACTGNAQCGAGLVCSAASNTCRPYCDATHACPTGSCVAFTGTRDPSLDPTFGACQ